jgi:Putative intracellular protease/amidase
MHRFLVMLYPGFCYYEIALLTETLAFTKDNWQMTTVAADSNLSESEDHFKIKPDKLLSQVDPLGYQLLILPGIDDYHIPLAIPQNIDFLKKLYRQKKRPLIASISSSPILLAKAGLLDDTKFMTGLFEEAYEQNPFIPKQNLVRKPVVTDNGIVTASGQFFREFAIETLRQLKYTVPDDAFAPARKYPPYTDEELTYR